MAGSAIGASARAGASSSPAEEVAGEGQPVPAYSDNDRRRGDANGGGGSAQGLREDGQTGGVRDRRPSDETLSFQEHRELLGGI